MALNGIERNYVLVRSGVIARVDDLLESVSSTFLIDANVFPGNSGGPVLLEPTVFKLPGTKASATAYLIGVVKGYLPSLLSG